MRGGRTLREHGSRTAKAECARREESECQNDDTPIEHGGDEEQISADGDGSSRTISTVLGSTISRWQVAWMVNPLPVWVV